ncbi:hypothetical protein [Thermococcus sp. 21S7]|uniref:hypothetical protein n=1 Tax=Thermococcus sp. 21S7 TaxID=1638221 RepID=UPI001438A08E|nr:hypothetical protein [Thermococcus sp. 21S7]NJE62453.1 hypothetical protein [Thermococcus sp. 21S7]
MIPGMEYGFERAIFEIVSGFVLSLVVRAFAYSFGLPWVSFLFNVLSILLTIGLIDKMPFWSMSYLLGWLLGLIYIGPTFLSLPELLLYFSITLFVLYGKLRSLTE